MTNFALLKLMKNKLHEKKQNEKVAHWIFSNVYEIQDNLMLMDLLPQEAKYVEECLRQLNLYINQQPLAKIINTTRFYGYDFAVNKNVFAPRIETELVVDVLVKILQFINQPISLLDMCCGTGVIGLSTKLKCNDINLISVDISSYAIKNTIQNANKFQLEITAIKSDLFTNLNNKHKFDIIVCNPPYISKKENIGAVQNFDPYQALFTDDNGYYIYKKIIQNSLKFLKQKNKYIFIFEVGYNQAKKVEQLLKSFDYKIKTKIICDYNKINRIIIGWSGYEIQDIYL